MKWGDFKKHMEENGVNDDTELFYRDMNFGGADDELDSFDVDILPKNNQVLFSSRYFPELD